MTTLIQGALVAVPTVAALATGGAALRFRKSTRLLTGRAAEAERRTEAAENLIAARDEEAQRLAEDLLPGLLHAWQAGAETPASGGLLLHPALTHTPTGEAHRSVVKQFEAMLAAASVRAEGAAKVAVQAATRSLQGLGYELQAEVTRATDAAQDEETLARALPIDHLASQMLRRLQVLGVLTGLWPGRQHEDAPLLDVIRGGVSRIRDYRRVKVPPALPYYLTGPAVEPFALVMAELLDNAARHSAPSTVVEVSVLDNHNVLSVEIHDAGPGMTPEVALKAAQLLSAGEDVRLTALGNPAVFGLSGVGVLSALYGFRVTLDQDYSRLGGCRAVVQVPRSLLVAPPQELVGEQQQPIPGPGSREPARDHGPYERAPDGLPMRGSRRTPPDALPPSAPLPEPPPEDAGQGLAAFVTGTRTARIHTDSPAPTHKEPTP
ncbi:ATP-binding protein [Streptomyces sp. NPDC050204]|uniref:ATP-binding protein n=1 Tax=Streptomyces sp. NPDC050204 TaxID=3155514 RepID=UPI0034188C8A